MTKKLLYIFAMTLMLTATLVAGKKDFLITGEEAVKLIGKKNVVFVTGDSHDTYNLNHIVGSVEMYAHHLHHSDITGDMHCKPLFMCPDEAEEYIGSKGIDNDTLVIAYDNFRGPNATGVYTFFKSYGHQNIKILDGGYEAIKKNDPNQKKYDTFNDKYKKLKRAHKKEKKLLKKGKDGDKGKVAALEKEMKILKKKMKDLYPSLLVQKGHEPKISPKKYHINVDKIDRSWIASKEDVYEAVKDIQKNGEKSDYIILDSRGMTEIIGERKLDKVARGGHVPGAKFIEWKQITDFENKLSFTSIDAMKKTFAKYGVTKDKTIYAYCHVGAGRSSHLITALKILGYENAKVYTGSWDEWGNSLDMPIAR